MSEPATWVNTTHDWAANVDHVHLDGIRSDPDAYAPGGLVHLVWEVIAYANEEAEALRRRGTCVVTIHSDGSVTVADDGRGNGDVIKKPVMATKDLRFFDTRHDVLLPDGTPRRGMSVVSALSRRLTHTNRRHDGAWTQRYEYGVPTGDLMPIESDHSTGTSVRFLADPDLVRTSITTHDLVRDAAHFQWIAAEVVTE